MEYLAVKREKLPREFFADNTTVVAQKMLGQVLVFNEYQGIITETESYRGADDPASHAYRRATPRSKIMFGTPGFAYVYITYGMYHCLNIVTESDGEPGAVLIRGLKLITPETMVLNGPGKLCRQLKITKENNNTDLIDNENFYVAKGEIITDFITTPRIGIKNGLDKQWRFLASHLYD